MKMIYLIWSYIRLKYHLYYVHSTLRMIFDIIRSYRHVLTFHMVIGKSVPIRTNVDEKYQILSKIGVIFRRLGKLTSVCNNLSPGIEMSCIRKVFEIEIFEDYDTRDEILRQHVSTVSADIQERRQHGTRPHSRLVTRRQGGTYGSARRVLCDVSLKVPRAPLRRSATCPGGTRINHTLGRLCCACENFGVVRPGDNPDCYDIHSFSDLGALFDRQNVHTALDALTETSAREQ